MDIYKQIEGELQKAFPQMEGSHDIHHFKRVLALVEEIGEKEGGDMQIMRASALIHDVHRLIEHETGEFVEPKNSLDRVKDILDKTDFPKEKISGVLHCVEFHDEFPFATKGNPVTDTETLVLQDADNLDAIGAIGLVRCIMYCTRYDVPIYDESIPLDDAEYDPHVKDPSALHHMQRKLLKLAEHMNTKTGKEIANKRCHYIKNFISEYLDEWK